MLSQSLRPSYLSKPSEVSLFSAVRIAVAYLREGLGLLRRSPATFLQIVVYFSIPAMIAAVLTHYLDPATPWRAPLFFMLDATTTVIAPVVFMMAVAAAYRDEQASIGQVLRRGLPWLPRYLWTNAHTSVIFWVPMGGILLLHRWADTVASGFGAATLTVGFGTALVLAIAAVYVHSRTLLAPFLAVHGNIPGSIAVWESWVLSGRYFRITVTTFLVCCVPVAVPLGLLAVYVLSAETPLLGGAESFPHAVGVGLQMARLTLIPAVYVYYHDLWDKEVVAREGGVSLEALPKPVRLARSLTAKVPPLGPMGDRQPPSLHYEPTQLANVR